MRIGASLNGIEQKLLNAASEANAAATLNALRLATGQKVNNPADDPSAFLHISGLESRLSLLNTTLTQMESAANVVAQSQLTLDQVRTELETVRATLLEDEDQSLTASERDERQAIIDAALTQMNILATSEIEGRRRLDGSGDFRHSGGRSDQISELRIYAARDTSLRAEVTTKATRGQLTYTGASGQITADATFTLAGKEGEVEFSVTNGENLTDVADTINLESHKTGITASVSGDTLTFRTVDYGTRANLDVTVSSGTFNVTGGNGSGSDTGTDAVATINGRTVTGDGNRFNYNANGTRFSLEVAANFTGYLGDIEISGGDVAQFTISTDPSQRGEFSLAGVQTAHFHSASGSLDDLATGGSLAGLGSNTSQAIRVVDAALSRLSEIEASVNGFADATIQSSASLLAGYAETVGDTLTALNEADATEESILLSKNQDLAQSAITSLTLLDQQRSTVLALLQQIAGV